MLALLSLPLSLPPLSSHHSCCVYRIIADKQVPMACIKFARQRGALLREKGLVPNYMSHLVNLFDLGLVAPSILKEAVSGLEETL